MKGRGRRGFLKGEGGGSAAPLSLDFIFPPPRQEQLGEALIIGEGVGGGANGRRFPAKRYSYLSAATGTRVAARRAG